MSDGDDEAQFKDSTEEGTLIARQLVEYMLSIGSAPCVEIPILLRDELYHVTLEHRTVNPLSEGGDTSTTLDEEIQAVACAVKRLVIRGSGEQREIAALGSVLTFLRKLREYRDNLSL